ncbi:MAG: terminase large subunit [Xanthobacteraceae bacterium]|nr:terminase large subunit [Xanthobacteraceae bacterium]
MATITPAWVFDDSVIPDPQGRAARMLAFADLLRHPAAEGDDKRPLPFKWQRRIIERIYGPDDVNGNRQIRTVFALLPRGSRKSSLASILALGHTIGPAQRPHGQVVSAGSDRTQARIAFDEAVALIQMDQRLMDATRVRDTKNRIEHNKSRSVYTAISAEGDAQHGKTISLLVADELHCWRGYDLWKSLKTGTSKVTGSLAVVITTAGDKPEGVCWEMFKYAKKVAEDPAYDPTFLPILFAADEKADWLDENLWHQVNPGLADGFPVLDELRSEARMARELPQLREGFKQTHLNIWSDGSAAGWMDMSIYDEGAAPIDLKSLEGRSCVMGIDLSKSYDITAIALAFPDDDGGADILCFPFLPETTFRRRAEETPDLPWQRWRENGDINIIHGDLIDDDVIAAKIRDLCELYDVTEIGYDPKFAAKMMAALAEEDYPVAQIEQRPLVMHPFYLALQKAILARKFRHGGQPLLRKAVVDAVPIPAETGLIYISKRRSHDAIDCLVAAAMAFGRAMDGGSQRSIYETRDLRTIAW